MEDIDLDKIDFNFSGEAKSGPTSEGHVEDLRKLALVIDCRDEAKEPIFSLTLGSEDQAKSALKLVEVKTLEEAATIFAGGQVRCAIYRTESKSKTLAAILAMFEEFVAPLPSLQFVVCDEPGPQLQTELFENGIEQFLPVGTWQVDALAKLKDIDSQLSVPENPEAILVDLTSAIRLGDQTKIRDCAKSLSAQSSFDYLAAFGEGKALQASGDFLGAVKAFRSSGMGNRLFRKAASSLGENLVITGQVDEAIEVFEKLEKLNKRDVGRKAILATAWDVKGDKAKAAEYYQAAKDLDPAHHKVLEAEAQLLLSSGKITEALQKMDNLRNAGPLFAARLNELGIKLSQAGKGKSALALYGKAHKAVRQELRFKISMNAALACHRMEEFQMGLKYIERCEKEAGGPSEKTSKIKRVLLAQLAAKKPAA